MTHQVIGFHLTGSQIGLEIIKDYHQIFDKLIPVLLSVKADGSLLSSRGDILIYDLMGIDRIIPMLQNYKLDSTISNNLINNEQAVNNFIANIVSFLKNEGYKGLCIDIEGVKSNYKKEFTEFIRKTSERLHHENFHISITIPAKSENNQDSTWSGAYDYRLLGEIVDEIIIMAYDLHWPGGPPGPIAPLPWVQDVIDYSIIEVPLEKLYLAFGLYGYDWPINGEENARGLVYKQIETISKKHNSNIEWDQDSQSPYLKYKNNGLEHEIWFENRRSIERKITLVKEFHLKGLVFWRLGQGDQGIWKLFKQSTFNN